MRRRDRTSSQRPTQPASKAPPKERSLPQWQRLALQTARATASVGRSQRKCDGTHKDCQVEVLKRRKEDKERQPAREAPHRSNRSSLNELRCGTAPLACSRAAQSTYSRPRISSAAHRNHAQSSDQGRKYAPACTAERKASSSEEELPGRAGGAIRRLAFLLEAKA
jgi:hypothetical protein